jgi:hypothetical protein
VPSVLQSQAAKPRRRIVIRKPNGYDNYLLSIWWFFTYISFISRNSHFFTCEWYWITLNRQLHKFPAQSIVKNMQMLNQEHLILSMMKRQKKYCFLSF